MAGEGEGENQPVTGKADVRKEQPVSAEKTPWRALAAAALPKQEPGSQPDDDRQADEDMKTALPAQMQLQPGAHQRRTGDENPAGGGHPDPQALQLPAGEQILNQCLGQRKRPATHCLNHAKYQEPSEISGEQAARCAHCRQGYSSEQQLLAPESGPINSSENARPTAKRLTDKAISVVEVRKCSERAGNEGRTTSRGKTARSVMAINNRMNDDFSLA